MKYWKTASGKWNSRGSVTLNMVVEFLESFDYEIIRYPIVNKAINGLAFYHDDRGLNIPNSDDSGVMFLVDVKKSPVEFSQQASSFVFLADDDSCMPNNPSAYEKRCLNSTVVVRRKTGVTVGRLENDITNYLLSIEKFVSALNVAEMAKSGYQGLLNVAEEFFGRFISLSDADYKLLAYTKHIEPPDPVNASLVKLKYHTDEFLKNEVGEGYVSEKIMHQKGVAVYPPIEGSSYCYVSSPVMVHGHMVAYLVMPCLEDEVTKGTEDAFALLVDKCQKVALYFYEDTLKVEPGRTSLLLNIISDSHADPLFIKQRAERLGIPFVGYFSIAKICWDGEESSHLGFYVDDFNRMSQDGAGASFVAVRFNRAAIVLVVGSSAREIVDGVRRLLEKNYMAKAKRVYLSDCFRKLDEASIGYRTIATIEKHERDVGLICGTLGQDIPPVLSFRDAFSFYWNDPNKDNAIQNFVISHMVVNEMARNDHLGNTDDLQLLLTFLTNERHAKVVAEQYHLHRNGVLYKIKKIEEKYFLDLRNYITRQYIQACIRVLNSFDDDGYSLWAEESVVVE